MRKINFPWIAISIALGFYTLSGIPQSVSAQEISRASSMKLTGANKLTLDLIADSHSAKVFVVFSNNSTSTLWFPIEPDPAYKMDAKSCTLSIWFGYSDVVNGRQFGQYMLPAMHPVRPGEEFKFDLTSPSLAQNILKSCLKTKIQVRLATRDFKYSRVRGDQMVEDYIKNSVVFESENRNAGN